MEENVNPNTLSQKQKEVIKNKVSNINDDLPEKNKKSETNEIKGINSNNPPIKKEQKTKGYVRLFRDIIKKKDKLRKNILENRFQNWRKISLKGVTIKRTIMVRISISKEKDQKPKYRNTFNLSIDKEKQKSKSLNKNEIKSFNKIPQIAKKQNNITIKTNENKNKIENKPIEKQYIINKNNYKKINIENEKMKRNKNDKPMNRHKENNINAKSRDNVRIKPEKNRIIDISSDEQSKASPKTNTNNKTKNIYHPHYFKNQTSIIDNPSRKIKINTNPKNDQVKIKDASVNNTNTNSLLNYDNLTVIYTSSSKKPVKTNYNKNNNPRVNDYSNEKNNNRGYHIKYEGYHDNNKKYSLIPVKAITIDLNNNTKDKIKKEYNTYESNKIIKNNKNNISYRNNSLTQNNSNNNNLYKMRTYDNPKKKNVINIRNNENDNNGKYSNHTSRRDSFSTYYQTAKKNMSKDGTTTVIQHYSGVRKRFDNFDMNKYKK